MDHKAFLASLPSDKLAALTVKSDRAGLWHLAAHWGAIMILGLVIALQLPGWPLLLPVQGILLVFLFTLEHEATHKTPFATEKLNEWVGQICGVLLLLPFEWFRYFHFAHHRHTNLPGRDPELAEPKPETWGKWLRHVSGVPVWREQLRQIFNNARGHKDDFVPARAAPRIRTEARRMLMIYLVASLSLVFSPVLLWCWLVPIAIGQPFLRLYLLAEHGRCPQIANMFDNTRTTFTNRIVRFVAWNMPYHVEHHVAPNIPFHRLAEFHEVTKEHLSQTETGYVAFTQNWIAKL